MDFSIRVGMSGALILGALLAGCGSSDQPGDNGSQGGSSGAGGSAGSGGVSGAGGTGTTDASNETSTPTDRDATTTDVTPDRAADARDASVDVARDTAVTTDGSRADASDATSRPDTNTTPDATTPPADTVTPPLDVASDSNDPKDLIREMIARLEPVEVEARCRELESKSVPDRFTKSANYTAITEWVRDLMNAEGTGAVVRFDEWEGYRNVEITIPGTDPTAGMYILGGHLDSVKGTVAMDDNGSGAMGMLLMARALSHYRYKSEIRCILFDAEEGGLIGSEHYATALKATGCEANTCVKAYINLDEVAYDPQSRRGLRVWSDSTELKNIESSVNTDYALGMSLTLGTGSCHRSDDCSFADQGYPTVYNFQATQSPYYHMPGDTADTLNYVTLTKVLQLSAATVATGAVPLRRHP
ncbi:MAG: M28 family peptidase [Polyangiaceae bacterium]